MHSKYAGFLFKINRRSNDMRLNSWDNPVQSPASVNFFYYLKESCSIEIFEDPLL